MGHYNFNKDLKDSEESVKKVIQFLETVGCTDISENHDGKFDIQYTNKSGIVRTAEVKNDLMYKDTGNVAIEFQSRNKPSGASTSKADVWYYVLGDDIYVCPLGTLRCYLIQHWDRYRRVKGGDDGTSLIALLPMDEFTSIFGKVE